MEKTSPSARQAYGPAFAPASGHAPLRAILWMLAMTLCFALVNVIVHHLGTGLPAAQASFIRYAWGILFMAPVLVRIGRRGYAPKIWALFGLRGAFNAAGVVLWFYAMARIPIADVTAIGYLNPIVVTLGGALLLGEGLAWRRIMAIVVALLGALIILRPGLREITPGHWSQLAAAVMFGGSYLLAKRLTGLAAPTEIVGMLTLVVALCLAPLAMAQWQPVSGTQVGLLGLVAVLATSAHYAMTRAFAAAPVSATQPVVFLQLVWAALAGWFVFGEAIDPYVLLGGGIIVLSVSYMAWREARLRRRVTPLSGATKQI
ncbi:DMT family transporter [Thioclava sp. GXIMD4216]|uniref:DMT family transporter n=1 Tax=Thioclava sp. GXIMD4216 TaxID=3131929 RepID=UPI0030CAE288